MRRLLLSALTLLITLPLLPSRAEASAWADTSWSHRVKLSARPERLSGGATFTDMTLLVRMDSANFADLFALARPDGTDLMVAAADGSTPLPFELVTFDPVGGDAELWIRMGTLSPTDNELFIYFGNPDTTITPSPGSAWSSDHIGVYHFSQDPAGGSLRDSGPNAHHAVTGLGSGFTSADRVAGQIGRAWNFNGTSHWVYANNVRSSGTSFTLSVWMANAQTAAAGSLALQTTSGYWNASFQRSPLVPYADVETANGYTTFNPHVTDTAMHQYVWTFDGVAQQVRFFLDGVEQTVRVDYRYTPSVPAYSGEIIDGRVGIAGPVFFNTLDLTTGLVDEYHLAQGVRSPDRIATEFSNQSDPVGFFDYALETNTPTSVGSLAGGTVFGRVSAFPSPFRAATDIRVATTDPTVAVGVYDVAGRLVRTLRADAVLEEALRMRWDGRDEQGVRVGQGTYFLRALDERATETTKVVFVR